MENLKLGPLEGYSALIVIIVLVLALAALVAVLVVSIIKALKERKDQKEDKAENEFYSEYGVNAEEMRLNQKLARLRGEVRDAMRGKSAPRPKKRHKKTLLQSPLKKSRTNLLPLKKRLFKSRLPLSKRKRKSLLPLKKSRKNLLPNLFKSLFPSPLPNLWLSPFKSLFPSLLWKNPKSKALLNLPQRRSSRRNPTIGQSMTARMKATITIPKTLAIMKALRHPLLPKTRRQRSRA